MLELVRSRVAGGAGQCVSLGLAAQLGGPGRGQVVADVGVHGGLLVVWMVVLGRLADAQRALWPVGRRAGGCPGCARVDIGNRWLFARERCLSGHRIDQRSGECDVVCGKSAAAGVLADGFGVAGEVQTADLAGGGERRESIALCGAMLARSS
jgi:hypothetical protein